MNTFKPDIFRAFRHYAGKMKTMQNEIRTQRLMNSLPNDIRKDIGWPDRFVAQRGERN